MNRAPVGADRSMLKGLLKGCRFPSEFWSSICYRPLNCSRPCKFPAGWRTHHLHHQNWTLCIILNSRPQLYQLQGALYDQCGRGRCFGKYWRTGATSHKLAYRERARESTAFREYIYNSAHFCMKIPDIPFKILNITNTTPQCQRHQPKHQNTKYTNKNTKYAFPFFLIHHVRATTSLEWNLL